jgi:hypothetical protein
MERHQRAGRDLAHRIEPATVGVQDQKRGVGKFGNDFQGELTIWTAKHPPNARAT